MSNYRKAGPARFNLSPAVRQWIYAVAVAVAAVLIGYGVLAREEGGLWLALVAALLGGPSALAGVNTPTSRRRAGSGADRVGG